MTRLPKDARLTFRLPQDLKTMTGVVATVEKRSTADMVCVALDDYFNRHGYYDPEFITRLATQGDTP